MDDNQNGDHNSELNGSTLLDGDNNNNEKKGTLSNFKNKLASS